MVKKLLSSMVLMTALSLGLTGCATTILFQETNGAIRSTEKAEKFAEDNVAGFVIQPDGKLMMVGENYVYVFNDNTDSQQLKKILETPEFLKLKEMSWSIYDDTYQNSTAHSLKYNPTNNSFSLNARFKFKLHSKQEAELLNKLGFYSEHTYGRFFEDGLSDDEFKNLQDVSRYNLNLNGTLYAHNESSQKLLKQVKPLSKKYNFTILTYKEKSSVHTGLMARRIALLPFAIAADVVLLPVNLIWALDGFENPFKP